MPGDAPIYLAAGGPSPLSGDDARFRALESQLAAHEAQLRGSHRPWFREVSSLVAVLALLFSFGTTVVSLNRTAQQDEHDKKTELLSLIDRLSSLTRDYADAQSTYANDPSVLSTLSSILTQQQLLAAEQAASVMAEIPGDVSSAEYTFVANVLVSNGLDDPGLALYQQGIDRATNANDLVGALRSKAFRDFAIGRVDEGRTLFGRALDVFTRFPNGSQVYVAYTHLQTQLGWAQAELFVGACDQARSHLAAAQVFAAGVSQTDSRVQQLGQLAPLVAACVPGASPSPGALPSFPPAS